MIPYNVERGIFKLMRKTIAIIGGGASGMMAAIAAARAGGKVILIEHKDRLGKKILATGNGKCNYTNLFQEKYCYRSDVSDFPYKVITRFPAEETIRFFKELGIYPKDRNGYIYPNSGQASAILDALRFTVEKSGVTILYEKEVTDIKRNAKGFRICTKEETVKAEAVILACGGMASPVTGSDGSGYQLAKLFGHSIVSTVPALVQLHTKESMKPLAGIRTDGAIRLLVDGREVASDTGELQLTAYGISGIPVFQVSRYAAKALQAGKKVTARLDFLPGLTENEVQKYLDTHEPWQYSGLLNKKLLQVIPPVASILKNFPVTITKTNGFDQAQVTAGGVSVEEIDPATMESKLVSGLYFAGELVDVDGICGGYNLQWAWSSGYQAGISAAGNSAAGIFIKKE